MFFYKYIVFARDKLFYLVYIIKMRDKWKKKRQRRLKRQRRKQRSRHN
jgi:hypothetical protein